MRYYKVSTDSPAKKNEASVWENSFKWNERIFWAFGAINFLTGTLSFLLIINEREFVQQYPWVWCTIIFSSFLTALLIFIFAVLEHRLYKNSDRSYNSWNFSSVLWLVISSSLLFKENMREIVIWVLLAVQLFIFIAASFRLTKASSSNEIRLKKRYYLITPTEDKTIFNALPKILLRWGLPNIEENYEVKGDIEPVDPTLSQDEQKLDYQKIRVKNSTGWTVLKKLHKDHIKKCKSSFSSKAPFAEKLLRSIAKVQHPYLLNFSRFIVCRNKNRRALKGIMTETLPDCTSLNMLPKAIWERIEPDVILKWTLAICRAVESCHSDFQISNLGLSLEKVLVFNDFKDVKLDIFESPFTLHISHKKGDEKSLAKIIEEICFIYENESSKSAPSILRSSITALTTSQEVSRLSHIVSMLDAENLKFPMISEDECEAKIFVSEYEKLGKKLRYDSNGSVYPIRVKNSLGVFKRVMENNEKYAIRQKRICIKMKHPSILNYWGFAYKEEKGLRKVTGLLMEHLSLRPEACESSRIKEKAVTLAMFLERRSYYLGNSRRIENWRVYEFALQLSDALMYCHETAGIIYRSLGPRSVLIYDHCNKLKLYDFTLSREPVVSGTRRIGAPGFQAPEMMDTLDKDSYGYNVDCWSYAMMIFYIIRNGEEYENDTSMIYPFNGPNYKTTTSNDIENMLRDMQSREKRFYSLQQSSQKRKEYIPRLPNGPFDWTAKHIFEDELLCYLEKGPPNEEDATAPKRPFQCPEGRDTVYNVMRRCLALDPNRRPSMTQIHAHLEENRVPRYY